ncbi:MAG: hypothetical protein R3324_03020 [Halobacteriales archaeon]|nr:hypothetical protein [Halobacteriales archaeon]
MVRVLSDADVGAVLELSDLLPVIQRAFERQGQGAVQRPGPWKTTRGTMGGSRRAGEFSRSQLSHRHTM